jgi:hypothetical protein
LTYLVADSRLERAVMYLEIFSNGTMMVVYKKALAKREVLITDVGVLPIRARVASRGVSY